MADDFNLTPPENSETQPPPAGAPPPTGAKRRRNGAPESEADLLAGSGYEHLPECFSMQQDGGIVQEREPCYYIAAETFIGRGREATLFEEGAIVVSALPPNQNMQPLNRAAALAFARWQSRLPTSSAPIDIGDMAEAAQMLASDPEVLKLNRVDWQKAVTRLAAELKLRRDGKDARELPPMGHNFVRGPQAVASPLLNAKLSEMSQRLPGETRFATAVPAYGPGAQTRRAAPAPMAHPSR